MSSLTQSRPPCTAPAAARLFVDSGAWIALRSRRDQHHAEAHRAFHAAVEQRIPLVTTNLLIAESHRLTLFRAGREPAFRSLERIDASPSVTVHFATAEDHRAAREWLATFARVEVTSRSRAVAHQRLRAAFDTIATTLSYG